MDVKNVSVGKPKTGGAIFCAPLGTVLPTDATGKLNDAFKCLGYCGEKGLVNATEIKTEEVKAWGGDTVLNPRTGLNDKFKLTLLEVLNPEVLKVVYGSGNVTGASMSAGITVAVNGTPQEDLVWVVEMLLTGGVVKRIVVPSASIVEQEEIVYNDKDPIGYGLTLAAVPDEAGNTHYEYLKGGAA